MTRDLHPLVLRVATTIGRQGVGEELEESVAGQRLGLEPPGVSVDAAEGGESRSRRSRIEGHHRHAQGLATYSTPSGGTLSRAACSHEVIVGPVREISTSYSGSTSERSITNRSVTG